MSVVDRNRGFATTTTVGGPSVVDLMPEIVNRFTRGFFGPDVTYTSASTKNGFIRDGSGGTVLSSFAVDEPRFVVDPSTGKLLGYLAEGKRTNEWQGTDSSSGWTKNSVSVSDESNERFGTIFTLTDTNDGSNTQHSIESFDATRFEFSQVYAKAGTLSQIALGISNTNVRWAVFDIENGTVVADPGGTFATGQNGVKHVGDGWYLVWQYGTASDDAASLPGGFGTAKNGSVGYQGDGTGTIQIAFPHNENPDPQDNGYDGIQSPTSPIETEDAPVSTAADDASEPLPASCQDGFVWSGKIKAPDDSSGVKAVISIDNGTGNEKVEVYSNVGRMAFTVRSGGADIFNEFISGVFAPGDDISVAVKAVSGGYIASVNGETATTVSTSTTFPSGLTTKNIANRTSGTNQLNSTISSDTMYPNPGNYSDSDLQELSR